MFILDIALAFALTMLVVAMVATRVVRILNHVLRLRNDEFNKMLKEYFEKELHPVITRESHRLKKRIDDNIAAQFTNAAKELQIKDIFHNEELGKLVEASTEELIERLKRSSLGQKLLTELGEEANIVFNELGRRYEVVGEKFTESFKKHSRYWATIVAFFLALTFNVDSIYILDSYIKSEGMRQNVIAQRDALIESYNGLKKSLEQDTEKAAVTKTDLENAFGDFKEEINVFENGAFPIGWSHFPHSALMGDGSDDFKFRNSDSGWIMWVAGIILTAFLGGLGAPFWYDTVSGVAHFTQRTRTRNQTRRPVEYHQREEKP
jgi:hypothetical protein